MSSMSLLNILVPINLLEHMEYGYKTVLVSVCQLYYLSHFETNFNYSSGYDFSSCFVVIWFFFTYLASFDWILDIANFTSLGSEYSGYYFKYYWLLFEDMIKIAENGSVFSSLGFRLAWKDQAVFKEGLNFTLLLKQYPPSTRLNIQYTRIFHLHENRNHSQSFTVSTNCSCYALWRFP